MSRLNFAEFSKHCLETVVVGAVGQALDKEVKESTVLTLTLFTSLMGQNLNLFAIELEGSGLCDGVICGLFALKLDVSKTSGLTVRIELKLARANRSEGRERIEELLLCDGEVNIANKYISFGLHEVTFLKIAADIIVSNLRVVKLASTSLGFFEGEELEESVSVLAFSLLVHIDDCLVDIETELLYMLV